MRVRRIMADDKFGTIDKLWHFLVCFAVVLMDDWQTAVALGIGKEIVDMGGSGFSWRDLVADFAGTILGLIVKMMLLGIR